MDLASSDALDTPGVVQSGIESDSSSQPSVQDSPSVKRDDVSSESVAEREEVSPFTSRVSFGQRLFGFFKVLAFIYMMALSSAYLYEMYQEHSSLEDSSSEVVQYATQEQVLKLDMAIADVSAGIESLRLDDRLGELKSSIDTDLLAVRDSIAGQGSELQRVDRVVVSLMGSLAALDEKVQGLDYVSPSDLAKLRKSLLVLSERLGVVESDVNTKLSVGAERDAEDGALSEGATEKAVKPLKVDERNVLSGLMVEQFVNYAGRNLMVMGDGVSGSIHVAAGDRLGRYRVVEIASGRAKVLDMMTNDFVYLVVK